MLETNVFTAGMIIICVVVVAALILIMKPISKIFKDTFDSVDKTFENFDKRVEHVSSEIALRGQEPVCPSCGAPNVSVSPFCEYCGTSLIKRSG